MQLLVPNHPQAHQNINFENKNNNNKAQLPYNPQVIFKHLHNHRIQKKG